MRFKGQISFDLIFAIIALIIMLQFMLVFANTLHEEEGKINIRNQLKSIVLQAKSAVGACHIADANAESTDNTRVSIVIPRIHELGTSIGEARECNLSISGNAVTASHIMIDTGEQVEATVPLPEFDGVISVKCGEELKIVC